MGYLITKTKVILKVVLEIIQQFLRALYLRKCIEYYFDCWRLIHRPETLENGPNNGKRRLVLRSLRTIQMIAVIRCAVWGALIVLPLDHHWRIIFWDQMLYEESQLNLIYLVIAIACVYMFNRVYFYANAKYKQRETVWLVLQFLTTGEQRFKDDPVMKVDTGRARSILDATLLAIQVFNTCLGSLNLYYAAIVVQYVWEHSKQFFGSTGGFAIFLLLYINGLSLVLCLYLIMLEYFIQISIGIVFTHVTFKRMRLVNSLLKRIKHRCNLLQFKRFTRLHTQTLLDIFEANRFYGKTFLAFVSAAGPTSAYQTILLLTVDLHPFTFITCLNIILYQIVICFIFHTGAALYTNRVHQCKGTLMHLNASILKSGKRVKQPRAAVFKLAIYQEKFCVKKKYGMTYDAFGLISFSSFFKFLMLYSEFQFYCYRWLKDIK